MSKDHFVLNRWILRCAGLWPPKSRSIMINRAFTCYATIVFCFVNVYFTTTEFVSLKDTYTDLNLLIKNLSFAMTHLLGAIKVLFWYRKNKELKEIIGILESGEFDYENQNDFRSEDIYKKAKRTGLKYTFAFFMMALITVSSSYLPPIVTTITTQYYELDEHGNLTFSHPLPYFSWIPFDYDTPITYLCALAYQIGPMYSYAYSIVGMDTLFMNMLNLTSAHISVLKGAFKTIKERSAIKIKTTKDKYELHKRMEMEYKRCVRHLQTIFLVCEKLEKIFKYLTLLQVLFTLFIFCTCLFLVSTTPITSKRFASEIVYMVAMGFQLVLYCWFGNEVTLKAGEVSDALWESDWLETPRKYRTNMLITMIRMRRPLYLTAGKFSPLTLTTFVTILRRSYSFFAVLKRVND